ncbi:MAG: TIGR00725 family protein [Deltaproteobacteria bacterium]|nr:MAG: TIGR00725 family protein [Deltaproteobacteria bacterium]
MRIGVIGAAECPPDIYKTAYEVGRLVAEQKAVLVTGGLGGVMEGASKGAFENGGITIGILPTRDASYANPYVTIPIPTGLGHARNVIVVQSSQLVVAISGKMGTLSEIAIALKLGIPVIGIHTWEIDPKIRRAQSIEEVSRHMSEVIKTL